MSYREKQGWEMGSPANVSGVVPEISEVQSNIRPTHNLAVRTFLGAFELITSFLFKVSHVSITSN